MKVLYNANVLVPPLAGIGIYAQHLGEEMCQLEEVETVKYFHARDWGDLSDLPAFSTQTPGLPQRGIPWQKKILHALLLRYSALQIVNGICHYLPVLSRPLGAVREKLEMQQLNEDVADFVYHETNFVLQPHRGAKVVTIHDLSVLRYPEFHPQDRVQYMTRGMQRSVAQADQIITVSEFVKREVLEHFKLDETIVTAIPHAADPSYKPREEDECRDMLDKYKLGYKRFLLVVGSVEPRKNLSLLMDAYGDLPESVKNNFPIVHVGPAGWNNTQVMAKIEKLTACGWFRSLGYVAREDLPFIFSSAVGLAFPSIYEGFGLPPLEAMSSGIPVLAGNTSSIPEVTGECGILVDPHSRASIEAGLSTLLAGGAEVEQKVRDGLLRAGEFSWASAARRTFEVYEKAQSAHAEL